MTATLRKDPTPIILHKSDVVVEQSLTRSLGDIIVTHAYIYHRQEHPSGCHNRRIRMGSVQSCRTEDKSLVLAFGDSEEDDLTLTFLSPEDAVECARKIVLFSADVKGTDQID